MPRNDAIGLERTIADAWDEEYGNGRYDGESPVEFAGKIATFLAERLRHRDGRGLYVGCGNGRNYVMLFKTGLDITGLDVSAVGLRQIAEKEPWLAPRLLCCDFLDYAGGPFQYLISIQAFQHGTRSTAGAYFQKTTQVLAPGGLFFLRVNASDTDVLHQHRVTEESNGGFTVLYEGGPKSGLHVHFFSSGELESLIHSNGMRVIGAPKKVTAVRPDGRGAWSQWEVICTNKYHAA